MGASKKPLFLFAHGAGALSSHPWMVRWAESLKATGEVVSFDYPYLAEGRKRPDPLLKLIEAHRAALEKVRRSHPSPVVLIGKSTGGRVGCHVALQEAVPAVVCRGYPLCGGGDRTKLRDKVLRELSTPILFVQGTRDSLCLLEVLARVCGEMGAVNELQVVEGGDRSLLVTKTQLKASGETQTEVDLRSVGIIRKFIAAHAAVTHACFLRTLATHFLRSASGMKLMIRSGTIFARHAAASARSPADSTADPDNRQTHRSRPLYPAGQLRQPSSLRWAESALPPSTVFPKVPSDLHRA